VVSEARVSEAPVLVSAVILTYRRQDLLRECLESLGAALEALPGSTEILVVDNGSPGNVASTEVRQWAPAARVVTLTDNVGYAGGIVAGIAQAHGEWILTLGDDATVAPDAVVAMLSAGRADARVGSVAAKMLFAADGAEPTINSAGIEVDQLGIAADRLLGLSADAGEQDVTEVFGTSGGAALYRRTMLEDTGGFEADFELYLEDVDLAWRARQRGWRCLYVPSAVVWHHHSATTGHRSTSKYFYVGRNRVRLVARNASRQQLLRYGWLMVLYDLGYVSYALVVDHTLAPVKGRVSGLQRWRRDRAMAPEQSAAAALVPVHGLHRALARNRAWARGSSSRRCRAEAAAATVSPE